MRFLSVTAAMLTAVLALAPVEVSAKSALKSPELAGFVVGYSAVGANQSILEEIPEGETVYAWSRMVTTQSFGFTSVVDPVAYVGNIVDALAASCPGAQSSAVTAVPDPSHPGAKFNAFCPHSPETGGPESFYLLAIRDGRTIHVKQAAFRVEPTAELKAWAQSVVDGTRFSAR